MKIKNCLQSKYSFLPEEGFVFKEIHDNGDLYSMACMENPNSGLLLCFVLGKGIFSVSISTQRIITEKRIGKYDKYYDLFYVAKLLTPKLKFSEIEPSIYPEILKKDMGKITELFNDENVEKTIENLNKIIKDYDKIRWKKE